MKEKLDNDIEDSKKQSQLYHEKKVENKEEEVKQESE